MAEELIGVEAAVDRLSEKYRELLAAKGFDIGMIGLVQSAIFLGAATVGVAFGREDLSGHFRRRADEVSSAGFSAGGR